jgi:Zn-dependent protease
MIPIPPLDGGNVLRGLLPDRAGSRFDSIVRPYGFILLYAIVLTPAFDYLVWAPTSMILSWLR